MDGRAGTTGALWLDAVRRRWALRPVAGESSWRLAWHMARWLWLFPRQTRWLRVLDGSGPLRQAAHADPRLYERWHRPYVSRHFGAAARRRIVAAHYDFVLRRFPARLRDRVLRGRDVRLATLYPEGCAPVGLHLRKPLRGEAGELALLLLTGDRETLASCVLTFAGDEGLLVGALQGAGPHTDGAATRAFIRGSGLRPKELLLSLLRELAAHHGIARLRAVADHARVAAHPDASDAFWKELGGMPGAAGCYELPPAPPRRPCADGRRSRHAMRQRREAFRREACAAFLDAFRDPPRHRPGGQAPPADAPQRAAPAAGGNLLAAGL
ncbi:hypothetical protein C7456_105167 [Fulvimonas soli]|uniref:DUF535 domain-containing protein n=1 Tax=Fulvimonas soli TaxID=155197 RepID=A0A316I7A4_9GAMM|nr:DUF535 family protein [Fulvimonas soli]PWK88635.1 hypothetical protein C7456_105167 [Fulvimonas soli]